MRNPFRPSEIVSQPDEFYGRSYEIQQLARLLRQGSIAIQGSFGVGKSSLLSRCLLHMDGFGSSEVSSYRIVVGHGDIKTIDDAARLVLEELVTVDSTSSTLSVGIPNVAQYSSSQAYTLFREDRHVAALNKILEDKAFKEFVDKGGFFIVAIDEVEKCAGAVARLLRQVATRSQLNGVGNIRFIFAGVNPFVDAMVSADPGVNRFIYETINLKPFSLEEARDFLDDKFTQVVKSEESSGAKISIHPVVIERIARLSGGHPHLLQLLGSHVIEHEHDNPDGVIDNVDLTGSLQRICYQTRAAVYESLLHSMKVEGRFEAYGKLLGLMGGAFPGRVGFVEAQRRVDEDDLKWFISRNIIISTSEEQYELVDELLRVRVIMDRFDNYDEVESELVETGRLTNAARSFQDTWDGEDEEEP